MNAKPRFLLTGGLAQSLVNFRKPLLVGLREAGWEVHAAAPLDGNDERLVRTLRAMEVMPHSTPMARTGLNPISDIRTFAALVRLIRRIRPEIFLGYTIKPVIWGTLAAWIARVPRRYAMITGLGYAFTGNPRGKRRVIQWIARVLYRLALSKTHGVFFQNPDDCALFRDLRLISCTKPISVVNGSGVDLAHFSRRPIPLGPPRFLMIARLLGDKGVREFAAAAALVRRSRPEATFHLVGGLDSNPDSIKEAEVFGWVDAGDIIWHGAQDDVRPFLADTHVFVLPSYREGTPRTVLEAMATGRPIITTDAPGCRETVIEGENGFLVSPRSVEQLAEAMLRFINTPSIIAPMGAKAQVIVQEKYCANKVTDSLLEAMSIRTEAGREKTD